MPRGQSHERVPDSPPPKTAPWWVHRAYALRVKAQPRLSYAQIAEVLDKREDEVFNALNAGTAHDERSRGPERDAEVIRLFELGLSYAEIGERIGATAGAVAQIAGRLRKEGKVGYRRRKVSEKRRAVPVIWKARVEDVAKMANGGMSAQEIARKTGLSTGATCLLLAHARTRGLLDGRE
jgi:DNA-binding NarL/FixJ family response regulator